MDQSKGFYTMKGYELQSTDELTSAMEDYLEMMIRIYQSKQRIQVSLLSDLLHVKSSSVTKMVQHLSSTGYVNAERYGDISLTGKGLEIGSYLLHRHEVLHQFLCLLNHTNDEIEQVEKIEHFLDKRTIHNLEKLTEILHSPDYNTMI